MPTLAARLIALLLLVLSAPLLLLIALVVCLGLGRPILFRQRRSGLHGVPFAMIKFRTMTSERDSAGQLLPDEQRLPALGRLLRRLRFDELPELLNVARGEMAFVGPRPLLPETVSAMAEKGQRRGAVRPGLTGWAQVSGNTLLSDAEKLDLDLWYVSHRSVWLDAAILLRTPAMLLFGERRHGRRLAVAQAEGCSR